MTTTITYSKDPVTGLKTVVSRSWTQEEVDAHALALASTAAEDARIKRNSLLAETDWTQVADAPVSKKDWAVYRQELRDITIQESFPSDVTWPTEPVAEEPVAEVVSE